MAMRMFKTVEDKAYIAGIAALVVLGVPAYLYLRYMAPVLPFSCALFTLFGVYCPGCGGTRAVSALLQGHVLHALWYHPLVIYVAYLYLGFMVTHTMRKLHVGSVKGWKFHEWYLWVALAIVIGNWILKNILLLVFGITM
ncbi:MAG: DUF2752 domain-containing protein [Candidatus Gastranaerophilales bacterium]|nr:DUF2752 domain-containing protein [Candidatus Gastranaerophilales bacterium]